MKNESQNETLRLYESFMENAILLMQKNPDLAKAALASGLVDDMIASMKMVIKKISDSIDADIQNGKITDAATIDQYNELKKKTENL